MSRNILHGGVLLRDAFMLNYITRCNTFAFPAFLWKDGLFDSAANTFQRRFSAIFNENLLSGFENTPEMLQLMVAIFCAAFFVLDYSEDLHNFQRIPDNSEPRIRTSTA